MPEITEGPRVPGEKHYELAQPRRAATVACALIVIVFALALAAASHPSPFAVERAWADRAVALRSDALTFVAKGVFDPLGRFPLSWLIVAVAGSILWRERRRRAVAVLVLGELASWATNTVIKLVVDRPRPPGALVEASHSSFPSGHAAFAAVTAVLLVGLLVPSGRRFLPALLAVGLAIAMAWTRTYLLAHWLTDVIGGLCVGIGVGLLTLVVMGGAADRTD